jgi:hypothetical protein
LPLALLLAVVRESLGMIFILTLRLRQTAAAPIQTLCWSAPITPYRKSNGCGWTPVSFVADSHFAFIFDVRSQLLPWERLRGGWHAPNFVQTF